MPFRYSGHWHGMQTIQSCCLPFLLGVLVAYPFQRFPQQNMVYIGCCFGLIEQGCSYIVARFGARDQSFESRPGIDV